MVDLLKVAFFMWIGLIFASQAVVISVSMYHNRIGGVPESLYIATCVSSAIPFVLFSIARSRGLPWSFEWGVCFPLACIHSLGIYAVVCFPTVTSWEAKDSRHGMCYLVVCLAFANLNLLLTLLGTIVHHSWKAVGFRRGQRPGCPTTGVQLQVLYCPSATASNDHIPLGTPPSALCFMPQPSIPLQPFDREAQEPHIAHTPFPTHPQTDVRHSRNRLDLTIRTDVAAPCATRLILSPWEAEPSEIGSLERGGATEMKAFGGCIKGEADRRFVAESSPKKHIRIGRGRDLA